MIKLRTRNGTHWVDTRYYDATGKKQRLQRSTGVADNGTEENVIRAQQAGAKILLAVAGTEPDVAGTTETKATVSDAFAHNIRTKRLAGRADATIEIVEARRKDVERLLGAATKLTTLTTLDLARYAERRLAEGVASTTVLREFVELGCGFRALGLAPPKFPTLAARPAQERTLLAAEIEKLIAVAGPRRDHILMYRLTGMRRGELPKVQRADVDLDRCMIRVRGKESAESTASTGKSLRDRWIPMHPNVEVIVRHRMAVTPPWKPLFEPWLSGNCTRDLARFCKRAGIPRCNFNDLRRSFCTELGLANVANSQVATLMGHTTTRMVDEVYSRLGKHTEGMHHITNLLASYGDAGKAAT